MSASKEINKRRKICSLNSRKPVEDNKWGIVFWISERRFLIEFNDLIHISITCFYDTSCNYRRHRRPPLQSSLAHLWCLWISPRQKTSPYFLNSWTRLPTKPHTNGSYYIVSELQKHSILSKIFKKGVQSVRAKSYLKKDCERWDWIKIQERKHFALGKNRKRKTKERR